MDGSIEYHLGGSGMVLTQRVFTRDRSVITKIFGV